MATQLKRVYVGCYTETLSFVEGKGSGVSVVDVDLETGAVLPVQNSPVSPLVNPTYVTVSEDGKHLYAVSENYESPTNLSIFSYAITDTGSLVQTSAACAKGLGTCYVVLDKSQKNLLCANYASGSSICFALNNEGAIKTPHTSFDQYLESEAALTNPQRQEHPHAHQMMLDPSEIFCYVPDLGADLVRAYKFDAQQGVLSSISSASLKVADGSGPRHMVFHPTLSVCYVLNELLSTITVCNFNITTGALSHVKTFTTLPDSVKVGVDAESACAAIRILDSGKHLYCSNRGHDSIARFEVDDKGMLTFGEWTHTEGKCPRDFAIIDQKIIIVANQDSSSLTTFKIDTKTGKLESTNSSFSTGSPACVCVMP